MMCRASVVHLYIKPSIVSESPCPTDHESCLTLQQFSENASQYSNSSGSLILEFLPGNHSLQLQPTISIHNVTHLKFFSRAKNVSIIYTNSATFELINVAIIEFSYLTFHGFGRSHLPFQIRYQSRPVYILGIASSNLYLKECKFHHSKGTIIIAESCNIEIYKSESINISQILEEENCNMSVCESHHFIGVIIIAQSCNIEIYKNDFINSSQILQAETCNISDTGSYYSGNNAVRKYP